PRARSHRETRTRGRSPLGPPRPRRPMAAEGQVAATAERLRAAFCGLGRRAVVVENVPIAGGECAGPLPAARLAVLCAPPELKELLAAAQEFGSPGVRHPSRHWALSRAGGMCPPRLRVNLVRGLHWPRSPPLGFLLGRL
ncbi:unnamed protein product, partial [Prorocentrum cordatum]